jgi:hypothetical protein
VLARHVSSRFQHPVISPACSSGGNERLLSHGGTKSSAVKAFRLACAWNSCQPNTPMTVAGNRLKSLTHAPPVEHTRTRCGAQQQFFLRYSLLLIVELQGNTSEISSQWHVYNSVNRSYSAGSTTSRMAFTHTSWAHTQRFTTGID